MSSGTRANERFDVVPAHLAIKAMRDSGYKNAAYAIAELIDNSIQAGASVVELLCVEQEEQVAVRTRRRIDQVAVLDNGSGMDAETLRMALQFGNGTHLNDRSGIGRFGMGLPNSSISQCRRVDVWTWQSGLESAIHSHLDIDEIVNGDMREIPAPSPRPVPKFWKHAGANFQGSGTLVVWSNLDRCAWRTAKAIINNSEFLIGRMYRRFVHNGQAQIRMAQFLAGNSVPSEERLAEVNDPMYLMAPSSTPEPYDDKPMFEPYGTHWEYKHAIDYGGKSHDVFVRFSFAKEEARQGQNAGGRPYGKHAARNVGVSIVRAGRELELSSSWTIEYDPVERWWGVEIEFSPELDEAFGVANNKQSAPYLSEAGHLDVEDWLREERITASELRDKLREDGDPREHLVELSHMVEKNLKVLRERLRAQTRGFRSEGRKRHGDPSSPEALGTTVIKRRQEEGHSGESDVDERLPQDVRKQAIEDELVERGVPESTAKELAEGATSAGLKYVFAEADLETSAFFSVKPKGGAIIVTLNTSHPAYDHLIEVLESGGEESMTEEQLRERLVNAWRGLKLLLEAWARYEDEQPAGPLRHKVQDARNDWGRVARQFLEES